jgi:lipopolysaccharide export system protein LptA
MKVLLLLSVVGSCLLATAQTNAPATFLKPAEETVLTSDRATFDGNNHQMIYFGHVHVTAPNKKLTCELLTVNLPPGGGQPTNIVAETNVVVDVREANGQTNHITADRAVYDYQVVGSVTNETVTFTGHPNVPPMVVYPDYTVTSEPLVWDRVTGHLRFTNYKMIFHQTPGGSTNASPLNILQ